MDVSFDSENCFDAHSNNIIMNQANANEFCDLSVSFNLDNSLLSREPIAKISHAESNNSTMSPEKQLCDLNVSFDLDDSLLSREPIPNISKVACAIKPKSVNCHTERLVAHYLKFNQSYNGLENMAHIMNLMDNVSIQVPESRYKIMKQINPQFKIEFHIFCSKCKNYTATSTPEVLCCSCLNKLKTAEAKYFVYIPIEQQLRKIIEENWDEILSYPNSNNEANIITDIHDSIQFKQIKKKYGSNVKILSLAAGTDGAVVASKSLWAIQMYQNYLKPSMRYVPQNVLCAAFYYESVKPNMQDFFYPLLHELKEINKSGGLTIEKGKKQYRFMPIITQIVADLPAKIDVQGMVSYNGYKACGYCQHPGVAIKGKNKSTVIRYVSRDKVELRNHEKILETYKKLKRSREPIDGVKEMSCMIAAVDFDLILGFSIDYMHCALLGVTKKCLKLWLDSTNHDQPFYIKPKNKDILSKRITGIKPIIEITRKPGPVSKRLDYKANEFRTLLLYYLRYCLVGLLNKCYIDHFQLFSYAIYTILKEKISFDEIDCAEKKLIEFVDKFEVLYGQSNITMNLHLLKHLANSVRNLGPLWAQSAFALEDNNGIITKTTAKKSILHSVAFKYNARNSLNLNDKKNEPTVSLREKKNIRLTTDELNTLRRIGITIGKSGSMGIYGRVSLKMTEFTSMKCKEVSTIDYFVKIKNGLVGAVAFYFTLDYNVNAYIEIFDVVEKNDQFIIVKQSQLSDVFNIKDIETKLIYIKIGSREVLTKRPNRFEKS